MCNEQEGVVWFIHAKPGMDNELHEVRASAADTIAVRPVDDGLVMNIVDNMYTNNGHATCGVNCKFDAPLDDVIDDVCCCYWGRHEQLSFREFIKMVIQNGIDSGMKRASAKYDKVIDCKNKQILELEADVKCWTDAFNGLLHKCQQDVEVMDFISSVIHRSCGQKY